MTVDGVARQSGMLEHEKVLVVDNTNGARLETYLIRGRPGSGDLCANGAASRLIKKAIRSSLMTFAVASRPPRAWWVLVDKKTGSSNVSAKPGAAAVNPPVSCRQRFPEKRSALPRISLRAAACPALGAAL